MSYTLRIEKNFGSLSEIARNLILLNIIGVVLEPCEPRVSVVLVLHTTLFLDSCATNKQQTLIAILTFFHQNFFNKQSEI